MREHHTFNKLIGIFLEGQVRFYRLALFIFLNTIPLNIEFYNNS
jgi:hypothetical protein